MNDPWGLRLPDRLKAMAKRQVRRKHSAWVQNRDNRLYRLEQKRIRRALV